MEYLVKLGGNDLYLPVNECSGGAKHFTSVRDAGILGVAVNSQKQLQYYLRQLIHRVKDDYFDEHCDLGQERINLLWKKKEDRLEVRVDEAFGKQFDFWVRVCEKENTPGVADKYAWFTENYCFELKRFRCEKGKILVEEEGKYKPLDKTTKVKDIFGKTKALELVYVGSQGAKFDRHRDDFYVVGEWEELEKKKNKKMVRDELAKYLLKPLEEERHKELELVDAQILLTLAQGNSEGLEQSDLVEAVSDALVKRGEWCTCMLEEGDGQDSIESSLDGLLGLELLERTEIEYEEDVLKLSPKYFKQPEKKEEVKEVVDAPGQKKLDFGQNL